MTHVLHNFLANLPVCADVGVVDLGGEIDFSRSEGIVIWKMDVQQEHSSGIGAIIGTHDNPLPIVNIVLMGFGSDI